MQTGFTFQQADKNTYPHNAYTKHAYANRAVRVCQWKIGAEGSGLLVNYQNLLLPLLSWQTHHNDQRWVTWIASDFIEKSTLQRFNVNLSSLRMIVDSSSSYSSFKLLLTALKNNRSSMVIASLPALAPWEQEQLEEAAEVGDCQAIILIS